MTGNDILAFAASVRMQYKIPFGVQNEHIQSEVGSHPQLMIRTVQCAGEAVLGDGGGCFFDHRHHAVVDIPERRIACPRGSWRHYRHEAASHEAKYLPSAVNHPGHFNIFSFRCASMAVA